MSQAHDTLFRWAFSDTARVVCLLRSVLPTALVAMVDWGAVEKVPVELLDKDLSEKRSDLVWSLPMRGRTITLHLILAGAARGDQVGQALPRLVWYLLVVREDATAQQLHQLFSEMLGKRAGEVVMTEAERLIAQGEERGLQKGLRQGLQPIFRQIEIRLHRPLLDTERTRIVERLDEVGPDRIGEVTLELSPEELARWLADPNAR